ncbi:hypothetical protein GCM10023100_18710 [Actinocorallia cavernae]|uniref:Uncharacterized protein n=2 Tax=Actinomycetes TaxID=1760 RepID=A0ABP8SHJ4_9ACTN
MECGSRQWLNLDSRSGRRGRSLQQLQANIGSVQSTVQVPRAASRAVAGDRNALSAGEAAAGVLIDA